MKKFYYSLLVVSVLLTGFNATAQILSSFYGFSHFSGSYTAISGGTVLGNSNSDDQSFVDPGNLFGSFSPATGPGFPLGFNFTFVGNTYDVISINNNGWISLGQSSFGNSAIDDDRGGQSSFGNPMAFTNSSAPSALQAKIAAFGTDLRQQSGSSLRMEVIGTTPNQVAVIQFENFRQFSFPGGTLNFQIRLYETTNVIEVVYGSMSIANSTGMCQVGLRGSAATNDFNLREVTSATTWTSSTAATVLTANCDFINTQPSVGYTYRWTPPLPCTSAPAINTLVATTTLVCPAIGTAQLSLTNSYSLLGISYLWEASTVSSVGPFIPFNGGIMSSISTPTANATTWYRIVATCGGSGSTTMTPVKIDVAQSTTNTVPYFESFEGTNSAINELPNCSWLRSDTTHCKTSNTANFSNRIPRNGLGYANFDFNSSSGTFEFYSNGIQLNAGVTYSSSVWYITPSFGNVNNVSLAFGPNQSSSGSTVLANVNSPVNSNYAVLTNTFVVATSGIYYFSVISNGSFDFLTFDDLSVIAPCTFTQNAANISLNAPLSVCFGETAGITAAGVNSYTWDTGSNSAFISVTPTLNTSYTVAGTNTLSGCTSSSTAYIYVNPLPAVSVLASQYQVCAGASVNLVATGATSYTWSNGSNAALVTVSPGQNTTYSVTGENAYGCQVTAVQAIVVHALPSISVSGTTLICSGDMLSLQANGANTYTWAASNLYIQYSSISPIVQASTIYTLTGADANGCAATKIISVTTNNCTGLSALNKTESNVMLYPNPTNNEFTIELNNGLPKTVEITDVSGRLVAEFSDNNDQFKCNLSGLSKGIYYVKIISGGNTEVIKMIKE